MHITVCETDQQSKFDAWNRALKAGALGQPWGERGSGWGTHVHPWLIHVNVWQKPLQCCKVISLKLNKLIKKRKKRHYNLCHHYCRWVSYFPVLSMKYSLFLELCCVSRIRKTWDLVLPKNTWLSSFPKILKKEKNLTRNYNNWTYFNKLIKRRANPCIMLISSFGIDTSSYNNLIKRTWSSLLNFLP